MISCNYACSVCTFCVIAVVLLYAICTCWDHWNRHTCNTPIVQKEWGYGVAVSPVIHIDIIIYIYISVSYPYLPPPLLLLWCTRSVHVKITNVQYAHSNIGDWNASTHMGSNLLCTHNLYIVSFYEFHNKCRSGQSNGETEVEILMQCKVRIPWLQ